MYRIGIDIGGTQLRVAAYDQGGVQVAKAIMPNNHELGPEENCDRLIASLKAWDLEYQGIGIGAPGPLDFDGGRILNPPNLPGWENFEIVSYFEDKCDCRTVLNNDANVAGLAEALVGAAKGYESVFYFTISTGVGGAYVYQGKLVNGANSGAAEAFTLIVNENDDVHEGVCRGALADQTSGTALARHATQRMGRAMQAPELFALAKSGDETAQAIIDEAAENLARGVANVSFIVDPDIFVFGGSVALHNPDFIDLTHEKACSYVLHPDTLHFELAQCGGDAGLAGAALLV